jgi:hypothetical protein
MDPDVIKSYGERPFVSYGIQPPYPIISSGERINLPDFVVINTENKFSHLWV